MISRRTNDQRHVNIITMMMIMMIITMIMMMAQCCAKTSEASFRWTDLAREGQGQGEGEGEGGLSSKTSSHSNISSYNASTLPWHPSGEPVV